MEYSADKHNGFNAVVHKSKPIKHPHEEQIHEDIQLEQQQQQEHY